MSEKRNYLLKSAVKNSAKDVGEKHTKLKTQIDSPGKKKSVAVSPNGIVVFDNESTTVEVTVKTKGKKSSPSIKSPMNINKIDEKKNCEISIDSHNNWSKILREQNESTLRQTMQRLSEKTPTSKSSRSSLLENKESRRTVDSQKSSKYNSITDKSSKNIPLRKLCEKKSRDSVKVSNGVNQPAMTTFNGLESVIVMDKGIQCGGIFDKTNRNFGELNPVRTLGFLMKEMEGLVNDERVSKILSQMEQALIRIPVEHGNLSDLVSIASKAKLEATTAKLAATSKTIGESYKTALKENTILQQHIQELSSRLKQSKQRQNEMELEMKRMRVELNDIIKSDNANKKIIDDLSEKNKQLNALEKIVSEKNLLEKELKNERELMHQKDLEIEYLKIEKAKLSGMSSYRNSQLVELRSSIKNLQNNIANQLLNLKDFPNDEEFITKPDYHSTIIEKGVACSSPTRTSSNNSIAPLSWRGVSELSIDNISNNNPEQSRKRSGSRPQSTGTSVAPNDSDEEKFDEKTHLEFTSIAGEKSLHSLNSAMNDIHDDAKFIDLQSVDEVDSISKENLSSSDDEINDKSETKVRTHKRRKKSRTRSQLNKSNSNNQLRQSNDKTPITPENVFSVNSMYQDMKGQLQKMFENMKTKGRIPVSVPEPPRNFPNPEWSDSSLPTMSISESNII